MTYFTTKSPFFVPSYTTDVKESQKIEKFLLFLEASGAGKIIEEATKKTNEELWKGGRPPYNPYDLLATILLGFAYGKGTLRDIESLCKFDIRFIHIMQNEQPSHQVIGTFINKIILPNIDKIYCCIMKQIFKEISLNYENAYLDGSKFEANANKYKFVWKPTKFHLNLTNKIEKLLSTYNITIEKDEYGFVNSSVVANKLSELLKKFKDIDLNSKENKVHLKSVNSLKEFLVKTLEYEEKERICGTNRNSFYKTDHDATAMCLKEDYYSGLGSNMHAAYNVQFIVINGFIMCTYTSQSRSDFDDFIPTLNKFKEYYGCFPLNLAADAGYGNLTNYQFLSNNFINNFVKHSSWEGNVSAKNPHQYKLIDNDTIECLNGIKGEEVKLENRHPKYANSTFFKIIGCDNCAFSSYCKRFMTNKDENEKIFEVRKQLQFFIQQSEKNLLSCKGIEMRVNRSSQVEGAFGVIKQNKGYERFRRRSLSKTSLEISLIVLGYNLKKLFSFFDGNLKIKYWIAPSNLEPESLKKPSAKKLSNKVLKKKQKSVNQLAKGNYKYAK